MRTMVARLTLFAVLGVVPAGGSHLGTMIGAVGARALAAQPADTTAISPKPLFTADDALAASAFALGTVAAFPLDRRFADYLQGAPQSNRLLKRLSVGVENIALPGAFFIGGALYGVGRAVGNERMADLGLHGSEAIAIGLVVTSAIKFTAGGARPYVGEGPNHFAFGRGFGDESYRSFPSGHTLIGFAAAAAVVEETRQWWPSSVWYIAPIMYGGAAAIGLSRMYDNKHWASDVIMGAAIGTFSGRKVVRYHHSHPNNRVDRWLLGVSGVGVGEKRVWRVMIVPLR